MARTRSKRGSDIRRFILRSVAAHPGDLVSFVAANFRITRQAAGRYVNELQEEGALDATGSRRTRRYELKVLRDQSAKLELRGLDEDRVWREHIRESVNNLPQNVQDMWHYACTEMVNNAIDHSEGGHVLVSLKQNTLVTNVSILDNGVGIFRKIKVACGLDDERQAVLELAKGKLTTDPDRHTGEGIFFTSRIMDDFAILSGDVFFSHEQGVDEDWILEVEQPAVGTGVFMSTENESSRTTQEVFDRFASEPNDYGFTKTIVPVRMAKEGAEQLVSRSQAKRLVSRLEKFNTVLLDFTDVDTIGRAFADEIFRVFVRSHPDTLVLPIHARPEILRLIDAVRDHRGDDAGSQ